MVVAPLHERADGGGGGVEDVDVVFLHDVPETPRVGVVGRSLVHDGRSAVQQRAVDDVAVARHPADVRRAPVCVLVLQVEHVLRGQVGAAHVPARGVHDALGLAGRAAGVEDVEGVFGIEPGGGAISGGVFHQVVIPVVAPPLHRHLVVRAAQDDHRLDRLRALARLVRVLLKRHDVPAPEAAVRRQDGLGAAVVDAIPQRIRAEAREDHAVRRADACAGEHGDGGFRRLGHVDDDTIALPDADAAHRVGELADLAVKLLVGEDARITRFALPDDGRLVLAPCGEVAIQAVVGDVRLTAHEPLGVRLRPFEDLPPLLEPVEVVRHFRPEPRGPLYGLLVHLPVLGHGRDVGLF